MPGVGCLFVGPYDLSLSLGTTVEALLADDSPGSPLARIMSAAAKNGLVVGAFGGAPAYAERFAARGITCLVVATDLWLLNAGMTAALDEGASGPGAATQETASRLPDRGAIVGSLLAVSEEVARRQAPGAFASSAPPGSPRRPG